MPGLKIREIKFTNSQKYAKVDAEDYDWLNQWEWQKFSRQDDPDNYYAVRWENGKMIYMHRQILGLKKGERSRHLNGRGWDNRRSNLKKLTHEGVIKSGNRWIARIKVDYKYIQLGIFKTEPQATRKYQEAKRIIDDKRVVNKIDKIQSIIIQTRKTSKYKGVTWNKSKGKWAAYSYIRVHHGLFDSEEEANQAVEDYREYRKNIK
jgi:hypothetical protein